MKSGGLSRFQKSLIMSIQTELKKNRRWKLRAQICPKAFGWEIAA